MGYPVEFRRKVFKLKEKKGLTYEEVSEYNAPEFSDRIV
ncbi:hypothetical protein PsalMR5_02135 [Piscirickettsia salmonis]|nr:hypothetical protein PsalSR1_01973 [Piscirickettsia salmonis]QGP59585.1 hypothetical protein PsalBI1_02174 [Piscirickettsia salmonis]QGP64268.1 hypothetical protein PsalMR5_02135 [Piscirickettsia salmonis]